MNPFNQTSGFCCNSNPNPEGEESRFYGILDIYVHHARNIHNICIYDNQDVYAKFSLTYNPDETLSTRIINGGGKNPEFNENLVMKITQFDAVVKCEMWMLSRAKNLMEDQLLGFALVPISSVVGKGKVTQDYSLSSTDLFHSPAGTVRLTLCLNTNVPVLDPCVDSSITSEVVLLLDRKISEVVLDPVEYTRIEFPDINVIRENQQMVCQYVGLTKHGSSSRRGWVGPGSFLHLGACNPHHNPVDDYEMAGNWSEENQTGSVSPNGSIQNSTMTSCSSDDRNSVDSTEKKNQSPNDNLVAAETNHVPDIDDDKRVKVSGKEKERSKGETSGFGQVFSAPLGNIKLEEEDQSSMQKQIVDMYMRSMQQFTESLAKMKLPMDIDDQPGGEGRSGGNDVIQSSSSEDSCLENHNKPKKKDGSRVFYGSRAFF